MKDFKIVLMIWMASICGQCCAQVPDSLFCSIYLSDTQKITIGFNRDSFRIDTVTNREGYAYFVYQKFDSVRFIFADISLTELPCCEEGRYISLKDDKNKFATDRSGIGAKTRRKWRELRSEGIQFIYYHASDFYSEYYDRLWDEIKLKLLAVRKKKIH